jgi:hypothetical protein
MLKNQYQFYELHRLILLGKGYYTGEMYVIIGSQCVPLEGKFLLIALVIVRITLHVIVRQMP